MDRKLRFAVAGIGGMGRAHIEGIKKNALAELAAVFDINEEFVVKCAAECGLGKWYTDFDKMLAEEDIDIVIVCTPDQVHRDYTVKALKAGKHVLCEKPMAVSAREKICKPDPAFFGILIKRYGLNPGKTLFIDDSQPNALAAAAIGFQTWHYAGADILPD